MKFNAMTTSEAAKKMNLWMDDSDSYLQKELDSDYKDLRKDLKEWYEKLNIGQAYSCDYQFGMGLYIILKKYEFSLRDAANDDVWRYLSLCVVPDLVAKRWGKKAEIRYYKQAGRIWLKTIWWYIHLSWQGNVEDTLKIIAKNSTDQVLQLVDRVGAKGYYQETYRKIMYYYWLAREIDEKVGENEFRRVMVLHTALCKNVEPGFYPGGNDGYARMLFERVGVDLNE